MPEGPTIVILKEGVAAFTGQKIIEVSGNSKIDQQRLLNKKVIEFKSWGKHFLICFKGFTVRVHFLMFGSYLINEKKDRPVRLGFTFSKGELNLYSCDIKIIEGDITEIYDWSADIMSVSWDQKAAISKLRQNKEALICDLLLNQDIFAGVGNIIKNEVLYRVKVHPDSVVGKIPQAKIRQIVSETRIYSFEFLTWKKNFELNQHWLAYSKKICKRCNIPLIKRQTGIGKRGSFFCTNCQMLYM